MLPVRLAISELNVANPDFFKGMNAVIQSTDLETIKTYLRWQLINRYTGLCAAHGVWTKSNSIFMAAS